jgi:VWFA-related protein
LPRSLVPGAAALLGLWAAVLTGAPSQHTLPAADHQPTSAQSSQPPTFTSSADLVVLHVSVQDRDGGYVSDLSQDAFAIFEDGLPQTIAQFVNQDTPVTVGLLIDNSISMRESRELVIAAAAEFADAGHPNDERFALAFNEHVVPVLPESAPFTSDTAVLRSALGRAIIARGRTALFDALVAGLSYAERGAHQRRVLVAISDGGDNASETTFDHAIRRAQASNVVLYTVTLVDPLDREANPARMERLAEATGGLNYRPRSRTQVSAMLQRIARDIRHIYTLGYTPRHAPDGQFHTVRVVVQSPDRRRLVVRTREGYLAVPRTEGADAEAR